MKKNGEITYKEIYQQPGAFQAINNTLEDIYSVLDQVFNSENKYDELIFTGCGTSLYIAQTAAQVFSSYNNISAKAVPCSELYLFPEALLGNRKVLVLPITRKSYTSEVRMAIDKVHEFPNVKTLAITCDKDSALYNDYTILSPEADEKSVIMTGSFTSMIYLSVILAMYAGGEKHQIKAMKNYKTVAEDLLQKMDKLAKKVIDEHKNVNLYITLGQGVYYGIANECMNKTKEMGLTNSEAYYTMEYRHGPMSLVDENTLIVFLCHSKTNATDLNIIKEMKSYGATTVAIGEAVSSSMAEADYTLDLDYGYNDDQYAALIGFIGQFIGCYVAENKGIDADSPRHLTQAIVLK
ncbi:MAG: SIS domain-containing protein [Mobilitalea sp.]